MKNETPARARTSRRTAVARALRRRCASSVARFIAILKEFAMLDRNIKLSYSCSLPVKRRHLAPFRPMLPENLSFCSQSRARLRKLTRALCGLSAPPILRRMPRRVHLEKVAAVGTKKAQRAPLQGTCLGAPIFFSASFRFQSSSTTFRWIPVPQCEFCTTCLLFPTLCCRTSAPFGTYLHHLLATWGPLID